MCTRMIHYVERTVWHLALCTLFDVLVAQRAEEIRRAEFHETQRLLFARAANGTTRLLPDPFRVLNVLVVVSLLRRLIEREACLAHWILEDLVGWHLTVATDAFLANHLLAHTAHP